MRGPLVCGLAAVLNAIGPAARAQDATRSRQTAIVTAAARVAPAVVSVNVLRRERRMPADPFDLLFMPRGYEQTVEGYGSGYAALAPQHVHAHDRGRDRKSTRLNSSHGYISYAVFCLK